MAVQASSAEDRRLRLVVTGAAAFVASIGLLSFLGWLLDAQLLKSILPDLPEMKANTALALIASAAVLLCLRPGSSPRSLRSGRLLSVLVLAFGLLVLAEYAFGSIGNFDQLLFRDSMSSVPGRSSPHTALTLTILALAWITLDSKRFPDWANEVLAALACIVVLFGAVGYFFGVHYLHGVSRTNGIALHTLACLTLLCLGTVCLRPDRGLAARFRGDDPGARMARVVLPITTGAVIALGAGGLAAQESGLVGLRIGIAAYALSMLLLLGAVVMLMAWRLREADAETRTLAWIVESSPDAIDSIDLSGRIQSWNPGAEALLGYSRDEAIGSPATIVVPHERQGEFDRKLASVLRGDSLSAYETQRRHKGGELIDVEISLFPVRDGSDQVVGVTGALRDIRARKQAERRFQSLLEAAPDAMVIADESGEIVLVNHRVEQVFGYDRDELLGQQVELLIPDEHAHGHPEHRRAFTANPQARPMGVGFELLAKHKDGSEFPVEISLSPLKTDEGLLVTAAVRDVSERRQTERALRQAEERFRRAFEDSANGMALVEVRSASSEGGRLLKVNQAMVELSGYPEAELSKMRIWDLLHPEDFQRVSEEIAQFLTRSEGTYQADMRFVGAGGRERWANVGVSVVRDEDGEPVHAVVQVQDATERKRLEGRLQYLAEHDPLTGLANRRRFEAGLKRELSAASRYGGGGAVILLDLDSFKQLNDTQGHAAGDDLLQALAAALQGRLRESDTLGRLGGDEFAIVLPHVDEKEARQVAEGIREVVPAVNLEGPGYEVTASIGIAMFHEEPESISSADLIVEADVAMYEAKKTGRDQIALYDRSLNRDRDKRPRRR